MNNKELIENFYTSFSKGDFKGMTACYHPEVVFHDNIFGTLKGQRAFKMWEMLLSQKSVNLKITFSDVEANAEHGSAKWVAEYEYGKKKRKIVNVVHSTFRFEKDKIIAHNDNFDVWRWTQQALGPVGYLLGWTDFMRKKIQKTVNKRLDYFISKENN